jgi:pimeloyl-ACP methyl ester carboxylesterase
MSADRATGAAIESAVSADGTRIAFERDGSGPLLVLVDGALCSRDFGPARALQAALRDRFTVVIYDRRGRGASGDTAPYAPEREFDDLHAVIEAAGAGSSDGAFVAGQSSGAAIVYRAAAAGVPMRRLAGYEAPWTGLRPGRDGAPRDYLGELDRLIDAGRNGEAVGYFLTKMVGAPAFVPLMMRFMGSAWTRLKAIAPTLRYDARVMGAAFTPPADELARVAVPSLVLCGGKSPAAMAAAQDAVAAAIPDARRETIGGQTHQVSAAALAPVLSAFFADAASSADAGSSGE